MKKIFIVIFSLFTLCVANISYSIEKLSLEDVPSDMPSVVLNPVRNLFSNDPVIRAQSAKSLGNYNIIQVLPFLYSIIEDTSRLKWSSNPLNSGVMMVGDISTTPGIEALISIWKIGGNEHFEKILAIYNENESRWINTNIIKAMRGIDSIKATQFLDRIIKDELSKDKKQYWLIEAAIITLQYKSDDLANKTLINYTNFSADEYVRKQAFIYLVSSYKIRDKSIINDAVRRGLLDSSVDIRHSVCFYLPDLKSRELLPLTRQMLENEQDEYVLSSLVKTAGCMKDDESVKILVKLLDSNSQGIRKDAAYALGEIKRNQALTPLINRLKIEKDDRVQCSISFALGELGDKEAIEPIIKTTKLSIDKNGYMQYEGPKALKKITGQDFGYDVDKYEQWWNKNK